SIYASYELPAKIFRPILDALSDGPQTLRALEALPALSDQPASARTQAVLLLTSAGIVSLLRDRRRPVQAAQRLNRAIAEAAFRGANYKHLAAPAAGSPINVQTFQLVALHIVLENEQDARERAPVALADRLRLLGKGLEQNGQEVTGEAAERAAADVIDLMTTQYLPEWRKLGAIE
ncbi:MAG TPA: hypothetical protein VE567_09440, partial [Sphingomonas sp.]|nr:hypothetical protein [Sphingomonas sp.]